MLTKLGLFCRWHSLHSSSSSLHLVSCFDSSTKGQLYQKLGKLSYCCTSLARQMKCFLQPAGPQEAVLGHWSSAGTVTCCHPGERRDLCFYRGCFLKSSKKETLLLICQSAKAKSLNPGQKSLNLSALLFCVTELNSALPKHYQMQPLKILLFT